MREIVHVIGPWSMVPACVRRPVCDRWGCPILRFSHRELALTQTMNSLWAIAHYRGHASAFRCFITLFRFGFFFHRTLKKAYRFEKIRAYLENN
jgi:hypothetical protein